MAKYILGFLAIVIGWLTLVGSIMGCYLIVQASHLKLTAKQQKYHALFYYARRAYYAGVHQRVLDYRGFDK